MFLNNYIKVHPREGDEKLPYKEKIPPAMIRRMKPILRNGVYAALKVYDEISENYKVDAVITATGIGGMQETMKFAKEIEEDESLLSPTPFIQSTHNTLGGQIALLRTLRCYNNTHIHNKFSLHNAMIEAEVLMLTDQVENVLIGYSEDEDEHVSKWYENVYDIKGSWNASAAFMFLSKERTPLSIAKITGLNYTLSNAPVPDKAFVLDWTQINQLNGDVNFAAFYNEFFDLLKDKKHTYFVNKDEHRQAIIELEYL